jgi:hypothetical protein
MPQELNHPLKAIKEEVSKKVNYHERFAKLINLDATYKSLSEDPANKEMTFQDRRAYKKDLLSVVSLDAAKLGMQAFSTALAKQPKQGSKYSSQSIAAAISEARVQGLNSPIFAAYNAGVQLAVDNLNKKQAASQTRAVGGRPVIDGVRMVPNR